MLLAAGGDEKLVCELLEFFNSFDTDRNHKLNIKADPKP
jgi:hypothetical protein